MAAPSNPSALARAGTTAWRALGVGLLVVAVWWLARRLMPVLIPLVVGLLLAALVRPVARALERRGVPSAPAALASIALLVAVVATAVAVVVPPFVARVDALGANVEQGLREVTYSVAHGLAGVSHDQAGELVDRALDSLKDHRSELLGDALAGATLLARLAAGGVLAVFLAFFFVKDGDRIRTWLLRFARPARRGHLSDLADQAGAVLGTYIRGVVFVATVDAVFIGLALVLVGVPLAMPLIVLTWVGAFFPIVGAVVAGAVAALVALVAEGLGAALIVTGAIIVVQQIEGNVLYPLVVGPRLRLHPVVVLLAVTSGGTVAGIPGAFLAVPIATVCAVAVDDHRARAARRTPVHVASTEQEIHELVRDG